MNFLNDPQRHSILSVVSFQNLIIEFWKCYLKLSLFSLSILGLMVCNIILLKEFILHNAEFGFYPVEIGVT